MPHGYALVRLPGPVDTFAIRWLAPDGVTAWSATPALTEAETRARLVTLRATPAEIDALIAQARTTASRRA